MTSGGAVNGFDINLISPNQGCVIDNVCTSSGVAASIQIDTRQTGIIHVERNKCASTIIQTTGSDVTNGFIRKRGNLVSGSTLEAATSNEVSGVLVTRGQYVGTNTNDNANAGNIGEYVESVIVSGSAVSLTSTVDKTVTSISLTAGDWDVDAIPYFAPAATTNITQLIGSISLVTNTVDVTPGRDSAFFFPGFVPGGSSQATPIPNYRLSLNATTTVFLTVRAAFTV